MPLTPSSLSIRSGVQKAVIALFGSMIFKDPVGNPFGFSKIYDEWPDPLVKIVYPSGVILPVSASYEGHNLSPSVLEETKSVNGSNQDVFVKTSEWVGKMQFEVWARDRAQRESIEAGIETSLQSEERYGFWLNVPGVASNFSRVLVDSIEAIDDEETVQRRERKLRVMLRAWTSNYIVKTFPELTTLDVKIKDMDTDELLREIIKT